MTESVKEEIRAKLFDTLNRQVDIILPAVIKMYDALPADMSDKDKLSTLSGMLSGAENLAAEQLNSTINNLKEKLK